MVEKASLALCINEAWTLLACVALVGLLLVPLARDAAEPGGIESVKRFRTVDRISARLKSSA